MMRGLLMTGLLASFVLAGCEAGAPNDVADLHELQRLERPMPRATDLPPGLSEDLPQDTPATVAKNEL